MDAGYLQPFMILAMFAASILISVLAVYGMAKLVRWLRQSLPDMIRRNKQAKARAAHPYRIEIEKVEAAIAQLRREAPTDSTRQAIQEGEELLDALWQRDEDSLTALNPASPRTTFREILTQIQAEEELNYVRRSR